MTSRALGACVIVVFGIALPGLTAPGSVQEPVEEFGEVVDVRVVNVDVYVTDRDGNPVTGLTRDDFELREDRHQVEIANFYAVEGRKVRPAGARSAAVGEDETSSNASSEATLDTAPEPEATWLVLFIDNANIKALHRTRVLRDVRSFLYERGREFDQLLLASYEGGLHIRQPFTQDSDKIVEALGRIADLQPFGDAQEDELQDLIRELEHRDSQRTWLVQKIHSYAQERQNELRRGLEAFRELVDSMAGLPGRKALLYVSDGLPMNPGEELFNALQLRYDDIGSLQGIVRYTATRDVESLSVAANSAGVTMYTLDASGLTAPLAGDVEAVGSGVDNLRSTVGAVRTANLQAPLRKLAGETGGLAFLNSNRFDTELDRLAQDIGTYYSLGFRPGHAADGRFHRIQVHVRRKGVVVRHRNGFRDEPLEARLEGVVQAGVRWGAMENPFGVKIRATEAASSSDGASGGRTHVVPVEVTIPLDALLLVEREQDLIGRLQLALAVRDADGGNSPVQRLDLPVTIPANAYEKGRGQRYVHELELRMRPGLQRIVVTVWDVLGQEGSTAATQVAVDG